MSLRDQAVQAMAQEFERLMESDAGGADWNHEEYAMHLLDALLLFLTEHTEEWAVTVIADETPTSSFEKIGAVHKVVAALRGTTEEREA